MENCLAAVSRGQRQDDRQLEKLRVSRCKIQAQLAAAGAYRPGFYHDIRLRRVSSSESTGSSHRHPRAARCQPAVNRVNLVNLTFLDLRLPDWRGPNHPRSLCIARGTQPTFSDATRTRPRAMVNSAQLDAESFTFLGQSSPFRGYRGCCDLVRGRNEVGADGWKCFHLFRVGTGGEKTPSCAEGVSYVEWY
jgi:hypothetical protein